MKFKKRFLMYLAIVGVILAPSMAKAQDANPDHGWFRNVPAVGLTDADEARTINRLRRNQTIYWAVHYTGTVKQVIDTSASPPDLITCITCTSAPLFIASTTATICLDTNIGSITPSTTDIKMYACSDSTCAAATSIPLAGDIATEECVEFGNGNDQYNSVNLGNRWVYIEAQEAMTSGDTALVWITGH